MKVRLVSALVAAIAVVIAGCGTDDEQTVDRTIDPFAGESVVTPGQGLVPYDLCHVDAPVLGAVTYDDLAAAGVVGFDDPIQSPGAVSWTDEFGFLSRGVGCHWFLEDGSLSIGMQPGRAIFDELVEAAASTEGESFGLATVATESRAAALVPADGYGGWTTLFVRYRVDESLQRADDQRAVNLDLLELFLDKARLAPPAEPDVDVPDWFACRLPDRFGSATLSVTEAGLVFGLNEPQDQLGIVYTDGVMKCTIWEGRAKKGEQSVPGDWTASVSFVFDEERSGRADPFYWRHEIEADEEIEIGGLTAAVETSDPERTPSVIVEVTTPDGRLRVTTRDPEIDRGELRRVAIELTTAILAARPEA